MNSDWLELSLGTPQQTHIPGSVADLMNHISSIENVSERLSTLNEYVEKLEQGIQKMNDLNPHYCILLLKDAAEFLRKEGEKMRQKMECEESKAPMLKINCDGKDERAIILGKVGVKEKNRMNTTNKKTQKSDAEIPKPYKLSIGGGGAFTPYKPRGSSFSATSSTTMKVKMDMEMEIAEGSSSPLVPPRIQISRVKMGHRHIVPDVKERGSQQENQATWKNKRRCWSPELHASFMAAAQLLGGPQVATPKQIRRIMQVEGLTNDQLKSHLQKVRLHNMDLQVHNFETANQHIAKPGNQQARLQDSGAGEGQSAQSWNTRTYSPNVHSTY